MKEQGGKIKLLDFLDHLQKLLVTKKRMSADSKDERIIGSRKNISTYFQSHITEKHPNFICSDKLDSLKILGRRLVYTIPMFRIY